MFLERKPIFWYVKDHFQVENKTLIMNTEKHWLKQIPLIIWMTGIVSLLTNMSSIMIFSLWPLYITHVFGLTVFHLGILEGLIEFSSWFTRVISGIASDMLRKRKPILTFAYSLIMITRPIFALAPSIGWVYGARILDRISNGLQATPREALVGDNAPKHLKGACFGLRQSLGVAGSILGAAGIMYLMRSTEGDYRTIFWYASIPTVIALFTITVFLRDPLTNPKNKVQENVEPIPLLVRAKKLFDLNFQFWTIVIVAGVFTLSNYSGVYRILQAERIGIPLADISLIMVVQNLGAMLAGLPIGRLSDSFDRRIFLKIGFAVTILSNFCFSSSNPLLFITGAGLWGVQMGITQSILLTMVADTTQKSLRGTAFGIYYFINALALFASNSLTGWLFEVHGSLSAFLTSASLAGVGLLLVPLIQARPKKVSGLEVSEKA